MDWRERILMDPAVHYGEPCIKGTRVPVSVVVGSVADGDTPEQIIEAWPQLTRDDIRAALKFAAEAVSNPLVGVRLKVDEDLPRQIADMLNALGRAAVTVLGQGWSGVSDDVLWRRIQAEGRWLITADKGFANLRKYSPGDHAGVILLRSAEESRRDYLDLAATALERVDLDEIPGAVVVITRRGIRIRRAPNV
jgi:uncharacterized protein (DUF433 family)/predicted nuclease of predicted toxin-antitoxin system